MGTIKIIDLTEGDISDPRGHVSFLDSITVIFRSNNKVNDSNYSGITFPEYDIPEGATFLLFDLITVFQGENPTLGNVNVGIQPTSGNSFFRTVQGSFTGTLGLDLSALIDGEIAWLAIGFPGGVFGAEGPQPDFYAVVSNLRFVDDQTVPDEQLADVPSDAPPSAPTNLNVAS